MPAARSLCEVASSSDIFQNKFLDATSHKERAAGMTASPSRRVYAMKLYYIFHVTCAPNTSAPPVTWPGVETTCAPKAKGGGLT